MSSSSSSVYIIESAAEQKQRLDASDAAHPSFPYTTRGGLNVNVTITGVGRSFGRITMTTDQGMILSAMPRAFALNAGCDGVQALARHSGVLYISILSYIVF